MHSPSAVRHAAVRARRFAVVVIIVMASVAGVTTAAESSITVEPAIGAESVPVLDAIVAHATSSPDGSAAFTFLPGDFGGETRDLPIGVFDSGIGGLTVLEAILAADEFDNRTLQPVPDGLPDFAGERFVYLGDQANMPYGNYPREGNVAFLRELILKDAVFLLGRRYWPVQGAWAPALDKPAVKAIVIACNTATAYGLDDVRAAIRAWGIPVPVVGVVEAGARGVLQSAQLAAGRDEAVAVLATVGTCASMAYPKAIGAAFGRAGRSAPTVVQQGFADLAAAIEGDPAVTARTSVEQAIAVDIRRLLDEQRHASASPPVGTVVLGCTHFPLVRRQIVAEFARLRRLEEQGGRPFERLVTEEIEVIDPASLTARELFRTLALERLRSAAATASRAADAESLADVDGGPTHRFFWSVANEPAAPETSAAPPPEAKFHRACGRLDLEDTRVVPLQADMLPGPTAEMIRERLPHVGQFLR